MPSSILFSINNEGRVYSLCTTGNKWHELPYIGIEFKRLSAIPNFLWAVGSDRQIYLYVYGLDVPIRIKEEVYENQRWNPIENFVPRLLPTDRYPWSNEDGTESKPLHTIQRPSRAWQWESDWQKELTLDGQSLSSEGWTYANDFPFLYSPSKKWTSTVRRRKWFRYRRYSALNTWFAISPLHKDPTQDPFIDVCIGGQSLLGKKEGLMLVWAVTASGRLMFREGVSKICPEGSRWVLVESNYEIQFIKCSPTGLTWAITREGKLIVRKGLSNEQLMGESWIEVNSPIGTIKVTHISLGSNSLWAVSDSNKVWFRKGVSFPCRLEDTSFTGTGWIEMVDKMSIVSVAANDQVWAIGYRDNEIYFRGEVTPSELTGRRWLLLQTPVQLKRQYKRNLSKLSTADSSLTEDCDWVQGTASSAPSCLITEDSDSITNRLKTISVSTGHVGATRSWSMTESGPLFLGTEVNPDDDSGLDTDRDTSLEKQGETTSRWCFVEAGAAIVSPNTKPNWFGKSVEEKLCWRIELFEKFQKRKQKETLEFTSYESAVERIPWIKSMQCKVVFPDKTRCDDCCVELIWTDIQEGMPASGIVTFSLPQENELKLRLTSGNITSAQSATTQGIPTVNIYSSLHAEPVSLMLTTDTEHDDWLSQISIMCSRFYNISDPPSSQSFWATTEFGEVFAFDPLIYERVQTKEKNQYCQILNLNMKSLPFTQQLVNGFSPGSQLKVMGSIPLSSKRCLINFECGSEDLIALHFNPRFDQHSIVRNHFQDGSWGEEEIYGSIPLEGGADFHIVFLSTECGFKIFIDGTFYALFENRVSPLEITHVRLDGDVTPLLMNYLCNDVIIHEAGGVYWSREEGHLKQVENCDNGVTWGIGHDNTVWAYMRSGEAKSITDSMVYDIYENQARHPFQGFSEQSLIPLKKTWTNEVGQVKTKDACRLINMHWNWETDWQVDFETPGGVDKDGWQYASKFLFNFNAYQSITDTMRRRRWIRVAKYTSIGPWTEVGNTKLNNISLHGDISGNVHVWATALNGDVLYRRDVTFKTPIGSEWEHVSHDDPITFVNGHQSKVWALSQSGSVFYRYGISNSCPLGQCWQLVETPPNRILVQVSVGPYMVWARDNRNRLWVRLEVSASNTKGSKWEKLPRPAMKFISVSSSGVWAISEGNIICKRLGVTPDNPAGVSWINLMHGNWSHVSVC